MVDKMKRRVVAAARGPRDPRPGRRHVRPEEDTTEFGARMRAEMGVDGRRDEAEPMGRFLFFLSEAYRALRRNAAPRSPRS